MVEVSASSVVILLQLQGFFFCFLFTLVVVAGGDVEAARLVRRRTLAQKEKKRCSRRGSVCDRKGHAIQNRCDQLFNFAVIVCTNQNKHVGIKCRLELPQLQRHLKRCLFVFSFQTRAVSVLTRPVVNPRCADFEPIQCG